MLELFSGENASFSTVARELGHETVTLDNRAKCAATIQDDILPWDYTTFEADAFDVVWASCPCDQMSQLRNKPGDLEGAEEIVRRTLEICYYFQCGGASVFIENPINALPRLPLMRPFREFLKTVTYCSYSAPGDCFFLPEKKNGYLRHVRECLDAQAVVRTRLRRVRGWPPHRVGAPRTWEGTPGGMRRSGIKKQLHYGSTPSCA